MKEEDDEFGFDGEEDSDFTNELSYVLEEAETPSKAARTEKYTTPARRTLPWINKTEPAHGLQTPQTGRRDPFSTPASSPFNTPTPSRFKHVGGIGVKDDLARDVFGLLHESNVNLSCQTEKDLRELLTRHVRKAEGFRHGQEQVRLSLRTKEAQIAELEYRISILESGLEIEHVQSSES